MNVEIGTEAAQFLFWEYLFRNFSIVSLQCIAQRTISILTHWDLGEDGVFYVKFINKYLCFLTLIAK